MTTPESNDLPPSVDPAEQFPSLAPDTTAFPPEATAVTVIDQRPIKLDLACGGGSPPGFQGVDAYAPTAMHKVDLLTFPWPWLDESIAELRCSHFVEHLPMCFVGPNNEHLHVGKPCDDFFFRFFQEAHRILVPGGRFEVIVPYLQSHRAFQDPTHRRFLSEVNFLYLDADWRKANGLDHYGPTFDFKVGAVDKIYDPFETIRNPETHAYRSSHNWNVVYDIKVMLLKPPKAQ